MRDKAAPMRAGLDPFSFLVISVAGWLNQRQQHVIEYLVEENRVLRRQHHRERDHQGLGNQLLTKPPAIISSAGPVRKLERVGGLLNYYYREAA
jgi:hypothetical protein